MKPKIAVIIPAKDEERAIGKVVNGLKEISDNADHPLFKTIIVCDNGSRDHTADCAQNAGATVIYQPTAGYGLACLTAIDQVNDINLLLFIDGDNAFKAEQSVPLIEAIIQGADLAIGSRVLGNAAPGALTMPQWAGNHLASFLIRRLWGANVTDLGPFRAISWQAYQRLKMQDRSFGWTVEMQVKAIQHGMHVVEHPVDTLRRIGRSKISGTIKGTIGASVGILSMIARLWWREWRLKTCRESCKGNTVAYSAAGEHDK